MTATMQPKLAIILTSSCHHQNDEQRLRLVCEVGSSRDMYCTMVDAGDLELILPGVKIKRSRNIFDEIFTTT